VKRIDDFIPPPRSVGRVTGQRPVGWGRFQGDTFFPNEKARALRKRLTPQEVKLWVKLRELKAFGFHFRRQTPIDRYIVDFVSFSARIIVEVDGGQHGMQEHIQSDRERDAFLQSQGFRVLRFWNSDVDQNLDGVMQSIVDGLKTPTPALRADPPHKGEG
jgi:very-short-patch-repair endonuclease